jgi:Domain of unknown function (DUF5666)
MKRLMMAAAMAGMAVFPAGALANASRAKVLSADARHHTVRLVDSTHVVRAYRYRGSLPHLSLGDRVSFRRSGHSQTISHVKKTGRAFGTIAFYAKVVRSGSRQVQLRLGDGSAFQLSSKQVSARTMAHAAVVSTAPVTIQVQGLTPGETVLISETVDARGHWTITLTLPTSATASGGGSTSGDGSGGDSADDQLAEGTITQVSDSGLTVNTGAQTVSFSVDPSEGLTDGFLVGDVVDVSYYANGDGSLRADDVEYVEQDATGVVSAVSDGGLTLVDDVTGQPDMFSGDAGLGLFDGVNPGDHVDVTYHQSATGLVADAVGDDAWDD